MNPPKEELYVPEPPRELFAHDTTPAKQILVNKQTLFVVDRIEYPETGGIYVYFKECLHPDKGFPYLDGVNAVNTVKKITLFAINSLAQKDVIKSFFPFIFLSKKKKIKVIENALLAYNTVCNYILESRYLHDRYFMKCANGMRDWIERFLLLIGISEQTAYDTARIAAMMVQYDNAYRYSIQDPFSEITKEELMRRPRKAIRKVLNTTISRWHGVSSQDKFRKICTIVSIALLYKPFMEAFINSLAEVDFSLIQFDEDDRYWCLLRNDYDYFGLDVEIRRGIFSKMHDGKFPIHFNMK